MADYEEIAYAVETIRAAHLFYEYGKLDRLLEIGVTHSEDDLFEIYYDLLAAATDYMDEKFNDDYEVNHWYFSFRSMMQYYRLIREYGSLHSMRLSENPYVKKAEQKLAAELYSCGSTPMQNMITRNTFLFRFIAFSFSTGCIITDG